MEGNSCTAGIQIPKLYKSKKTCLPWLLMPGIGHLQWKYIAEANISPHSESLPLASSTWLLVVRSKEHQVSQHPSSRA